ncbi:zinc finger CCCH domain-containing protein 19 [Tanacetum coccineum]|uniref:Zinc finger CCCH domain-containing protein 19 n=1 Tax=Tanacetum coccineum TaxID=301880 RepID=A0ABQ5I346_9ASTR
MFFQSFTRMLKRHWANKSVDMSGKYGTSNAGAESVGVSDYNKVYKEAGNEAVMSISVDDSALKLMSSEEIRMKLVLDMLGDVGFGWNSTLWIKWKASRLQRRSAIGFMGPEVIRSWSRSVGKQRGLRDMVRRTKVLMEGLLTLKESLHSVKSPLEFSYSGFAITRRLLVGWKVILWTLLKKAEIRDDSVLYNDGCIKDCMEKNLEDDAGEILGVHSQGDCGNVTTDDNEDVTQSGSSWIDYIGPLTSDEIDSDKRWSYRDPNGNIHGLFSLAQLRSWKDYFPSDLQIWSYYGNVKEAILLHNALSRQTKDAG